MPLCSVTAMGDLAGDTPNAAGCDGAGGTRAGVARLSSGAKTHTTGGGMEQGTAVFEVLGRFFISFSAVRGQGRAFDYWRPPLASATSVAAGLEPAHYHPRQGPVDMGIIAFCSKDIKSPWNRQRGVNYIFPGKTGISAEELKGKRWRQRAGGEWG